MIEDYESSRPPRSRATVTRHGSRFTIDLPAPGGWGSVTAVAVLMALVLGGIFVVFVVGILASDRFIFEPNRLGHIVGELLLVGFAVSLGGVTHLSKATRWSRITIAAGGLTIETANWLSRAVRSLPVKEVLAVGERRGLWVSACHGKHVFLKERRADEIGWVADVLQAELGVTDQTPPEKDELAVRYDTLDLEGVPGLMRVEPGRIVVEHGFALTQGFSFQPRRGGNVLTRKVTPGSVVSVVPEDLTCRPAEGGGSCLEIRTTGKREKLVIWSDNAETLPRAVAKFWGRDPDDDAAPD